MSLRARLIVAFLALSVVPLGAITWYSYVSNERALRDAAEHESDMLAGELSTRMQVVTGQLSERVEHLMDMGEGSETLAPASALTVSQPPTTPTPANGSAPAAAPSPEQAFEAQVAARLGEAAMLLNNVEFPTPPPPRGAAPPGRGGGRTGRGGPQPGRGTSGATGASVAATSGPQPAPGPPTPGTVAPSSGAPPLGTEGAGRSPFPSPRSGRNNPPPVATLDAGGSDRSGPRDPRGRPGGPPRDPRTNAAGNRDPRGGPAPPRPLPSRPLPFLFGPPGATLEADAQFDGVKIDLGRIRREMFREIAPNASPDSLTNAERQRIVSEVNQRLLGVVQGLKLGAAELQKQADEAKRQAVAKPAPAPGVRTNPVSGTNTTVTKRLAINGKSLNVSREENGQVVNSVKAEINLPDLLATVFSVTPRERGEVPFAVDKDGHLYTPTEEDRKKVAALGDVITSPDTKLGVTQLTDWTVFTAQDPTGSGLRFGIARPVGEAMMELRKNAARSAGLGLLFIAIALVGVVPLSNGLTRNLSRLNDGVKRIASGDYGARVAVNTHDEVGELAQAFNQMAGHVEQHRQLAVERERITRQLELGRQIQHDMLPRAPLRVGGTEVLGISEMADEVGGDFYNFFELANGRVALLIGDVSGKGIGAALLMANIQASLRTRLSLGQDLTALANELDRDIQDNTPGAVYSTLFVGILDPSTRTLEYVNAGHNPQYALRRDGLERLESSGLPIGLLAGHGYTKRALQFDAGDILFCYTDGCVETENEKDQEFGAEALERELKKIGPRDAEAVLTHIQGAILAFRGARKPFDDATMMVAKVG